LESQQPLQFEGPQFCVWVSQTALTHACSAAHEAHAAPPSPHAVWLLPGWQLPLASQHPVQVVALHSTSTHVPSGHCSPFAHCTQVTPPDPHAPALVPGMHAPL